jgi:hypothetical protein
VSVSSARAAACSGRLPGAEPFRPPCRVIPTAWASSTTWSALGGCWPTPAIRRGGACPSSSSAFPSRLSSTPTCWSTSGPSSGPTCTSGHDPHDFAGCDLWLTGWTADYPDPDGFFHGLFRSEWSFYRDEDIDELLAEARSLGNQAERLRLYHEIDRLWVAEHAGILPLSYGRAMLLRRPWVEGLWASPLSRAHLDEVVVRREEAASTVPAPDEPEALESEQRIDPFDRL